MRIVNRTSLPHQIKLGDNIYELDIHKTTCRRGAYPFDAKNCIQVDVLHKNLRGRTDLHDMPYKPTIWIFSKVN